MFFVLFFLLAAAAPAAETAVHAWDLVEVEMTAEHQPEALERGEAASHVEFHRKGSNDRIRVAVFWDGGRTFRARFAPARAGDWEYRALSDDRGIKRTRGTVHVEAWTDEELRANPARRGFVTVSADGHHFAYADGTPFLWIGDTWWAWYKKGIHLETFRKLADDRAKKGYNLGQMYFPGKGGLLNGNTLRPEFEQIRNVEAMIAYANSRGITVWIHPWWSGKNLAANGADLIRDWWRYVIARLGAYNVIWTLAGEYNMDNYGGMGLDFWRELGAMVRREDPYRRLIGAHPTPPLWTGGEAAPQWSTGEVLHNEPWLDFNQSQVGHSQSRNEMIPIVMAADYARRPAKPTVVTEPWYEFIAGHPTGADVRFAAWSAVLSGAAGHTYGGGHVWWAHVPEVPNNQGNWPLERGFENDTLDYPGAVGVGVMGRFLRTLEWWKLVPHPELVRHAAAPYCAAVPGREYVLYLRWGGGLQLDLRPSAESDEFEYTFIDPATGTKRPVKTVKGGAFREFKAPDDYPAKLETKDWVLHIRRRTR